MIIHVFNIPTISNKFKFKILNNMDYENRPFPKCVQSTIKKKNIYIYIFVTYIYFN